MFTLTVVGLGVYAGLSLAVAFINRLIDRLPTGRSEAHWLDG